MEKHLHWLLCIVCAFAFAEAQPRPLNAPSDSGLVAEMLALKDISCAYDFNPTKLQIQITVTTVKIYNDGREDKRETLPTVYPTFKAAMMACGEFYDKTFAEHLYAVLYRRNTVAARK